MRGKIPIIGYRVSYHDVLSWLKNISSKNNREEFQNILSDFLHSKHVYFSNSGISSFYLILQILKMLSSRKEVILPSYTSPSLVVAVKKAGLTPILCDISLEDFNIELGAVKNHLTPETLCVVCVHMFGIPVSGIENLKNELPDGVFLIEDCAQAMGSRISQQLVGNFGDFGVLSFNRGKNLPTFGGGGILTESNEHAKSIERLINELPCSGISGNVSLFLKLCSLSIVFKPLFYSLFYPVISLFKEDEVPKDFIAGEYTSMQAGFGTILLREFQVSCTKRFSNAKIFLQELKDDKGIRIPSIKDNLMPAFNRFPIAIEDLDRKENIEKNLWNAGIETSGMYLKPLHHIFDLGYKKNDFPNSVFFAEHLLTLPVHPLVTENDCKKMVECIRKTN
jgi:dTDP-4-amino-4,6-dideoxygalactose transaminase